MIDRPTLIAFRFGYGLPHKGVLDPDAMLAALVGTDIIAVRYPTLGFDAALPMMARANEARKMARQDSAQRPAYQTAIREVTLAAEGSMRAEFARRLDAPDAFRERLCAFWTDHFTTKARSAPERPLPAR